MVLMVGRVLLELDMPLANMVKLVVGVLTDPNGFVRFGDKRRAAIEGPIHLWRNVSMLGPPMMQAIYRLSNQQLEKAHHNPIYEQTPLGKGSPLSNGYCAAPPPRMS
eukprot:746070-Hanusia_phi.AAC.3